MRAKLWAVAALAAGMVLGAWGESITRAGVTYARRGGLGTGDFVATNVAQTAADVGAVPNDAVYEAVKAKANNALPNDKGEMVGSEAFVQAVTEVAPPAPPAPVQSVNGRTGAVVLDAAAVEALPDDENGLVEKASFSNAVVRVSPPVELPAKWALANVTNANGEAVSAEDVGALPLYDGDMDIYGEPSWYFTSGGMRLGQLGDYQWGMYADTLGGVNGIWGWSRSIFDAMPHIALDYPDYGCIVLNADDGKKVYYTTGTEMVGDDREVAVKGDIPKWFATSSITNANGNVIDDEGKLTYGKIIDRNGYETHGIHAKNGGNNVYLTTDGLSAVDEGGYSPNLGLCVHSEGWAWSDYSVDAIHFCPSGYGQLFYYYFPYNSGTIALEGWQSLSRSLNDACTNRTADCESISTNLCRLIEPHIEAVNVVEQFWDAELAANWQLRLVGGDLKMSVSTNADMTAFQRANPVLTDEVTKQESRLHTTAGELKFFTR